MVLDRLELLRLLLVQHDGRTSGRIESEGVEGPASRPSERGQAISLRCVLRAKDQIPSLQELQPFLQFSRPQAGVNDQFGETRGTAKREADECADFHGF
jgi:hypothetical protein